MTLVSSEAETKLQRNKSSLTRTDQDLPRAIDHLEVSYDLLVPVQQQSFPVNILWLAICQLLVAVVIGLHQ